MKTEKTNGKARPKANGKPLEKETTKPPRVVGKPVSRDLKMVRPNVWNMNEMTSFQKEALRHGLNADGWVASQALLVWGTDEKGKTKNIIIDGEHRWTEALELGFKRGPMVFLDRMTEMQAKALTVKMNHKRGESNQEKLGKLLREIQYEYAGEFAMEMGIMEPDLMPLLAEPEIILPGDMEIGDGSIPGGNSGVPNTNSNVRMQQLFFNPETHAEFSELIRSLAKVYKTENVTDTTLEAVRRAARSTTNKS